MSSSKITLTKTLDVQAVRRARETALAGLRSPEFADVLGRLRLTDRITELDYSIGKRWRALVADYAIACQSPRQPSSCALEGGTAGRPPDLDSIAGRREAARHRRIVAIFRTPAPRCVTPAVQPRPPSTKSSSWIARRVIFANWKRCEPACRRWRVTGRSDARRCFVNRATES